jgi:hypothetical protein
VKGQPPDGEVLGEAPVFTLIAGANGAGKSTLTGGNPEKFGTSPLLDPDTFMKPPFYSRANTKMFGLL